MRISDWSSDVCSSDLPKDFTIIGQPAKRLDAPGKVNGTAEFGIDVKLTGMKIAAIAISPVLGGTPKSVDEAAAMAVKGVSQAVKTDERVAVVEDHMGAAKKGIETAARAEARGFRQEGGRKG